MRFISWQKAQGRHLIVKGLHSKPPPSAVLQSQSGTQPGSAQQLPLLIAAKTEGNKTIYLCRGLFPSSPSVSTSSFPTGSAVNARQRRVCPWPLRGQRPCSCAASEAPQGKKTIMGNVPISLAPSASRASVLGDLAFSGNTARLLPCGRRSAAWFPNQLRGLCLQEANKLV